MRIELHNELYESHVRQLLDLGLTTEPRPQIMFTDEPKFPEYFCYPKNVSDKLDKARGNGHSNSHSLSKLKAVAECIERMAFYYPKLNLVSGRYSEVEQAVDPADFVNFSDWQMDGKRKKYLEDARASEFLWEKGFDHTNGRPCNIPGQVVYLTSDFKDEKTLREQNTTGAAFGFNFDEAFCRGLLEVIERDAFMLTYLKRISPPKIDYSKSDYLVKLAEYFGRYNLEFGLFDITTDLRIPVVMAVAIDRTGIGPSINIGACADIDMETAAIKASHESVMARNSFRFGKETEGIPKLAPADVKDEIDRGFYWYPVERIPELDFLISSKENAPLKKSDDMTTKEKLDKILSELNRMKFRAVSVNVSQPEVAECGWAVVKAVVPELHPLYLGEDFKALYSVHAGELPELGLPPQPFL